MAEWDDYVVGIVAKREPLALGDLLKYQYVKRRTLGVELSVQTVVVVVVGCVNES